MLTRTAFCFPSESQLPGWYCIPLPSPTYPPAITPNPTLPFQTSHYLRNLIPCKAKLLLYKSFILPYLTYCHLTWHFCKSSDKRKLERIQERALRVIYRSHSATYEELLRRADIPFLYNRRLQDITVLMYKVKHGLVPDCVSELFVRKSSTHSLRNSDFVLPRFETIRYGKHSVRYLGPFLWSKLTENQRDSPSLRVFINKIRKLNLDEIVINNSNCCNLCSQ